MPLIMVLAFVGGFSVGFSILTSDDYTGIAALIGGTILGFIFSTVVFISTYLHYLLEGMR